MRNLNYNHLYYFWVVAREGSIAKASEILFLTPQTVSGQIRILESHLGEKLFTKAGRNLMLTDFGHTLFQYAEDIFKLGSELLDLINGRTNTGQLIFRVGISDHIPKPIAYKIIEPALRTKRPTRIICHEGKIDDLVGELSIHKLDLVLAGNPVNPNLSVRVYNHLLGQSGVSFFASPGTSDQRRAFPDLLRGAPMLVPTTDSVMRRSLEKWFEEEDIHPKITGEFDDGALMMAFGQAGAGIFAAPSVIKNEIRRQYKVDILGSTDRISEDYYAITAERKLKHPLILAVHDAAQSQLFEDKAGLESTE